MSLDGTVWLSEEPASYARTRPVIPPMPASPAANSPVGPLMTLPPYIDFFHTHIYAMFSRGTQHISIVYHTLIAL